MNRLTGCDHIRAFGLALKRPPSLRRAMRRSDLAASHLSESACGQVTLTNLAALGFEGIGPIGARIRDDDALAAAFRKSLTNHERITVRMREAEAATYEERTRPTVAACCELHIADIYEDDLNGL